MESDEVIVMKKEDITSRLKEEEEGEKMEKDDKNKDDKLLLEVALGSSAVGMANMEEYESMVLSTTTTTATTVPLLYDPKMEWSGGFPSILPSFRVDTWQQVQNDLEGIYYPQYAMKESEQALLLRMQYFLSLRNSYPNSKIPKVHLQRAKKIDAKRQEQFAKRKQQRKQKRTMNTNNNNNNTVDDDHDEDDDHEILTPGQRLEQIKKGPSSSSSSHVLNQFSSSSQAVTHRNTQLAIFVWRTQQKRKRKRKSRNDNSIDNNAEPSPEEIYLKRKERWEQRMARRNKNKNGMIHQEKSSSIKTTTRQKIKKKQIKRKKTNTKQKTQKLEMHQVLENSNSTMECTSTSSIPRKKSRNTTKEMNSEDEKLGNDSDKPITATTRHTEQNNSNEWSVRPRRSARKTTSYAENDDEDIEDDERNHTDQYPSPHLPHEQKDSDVEIEIHEISSTENDDDCIHLDEFEMETNCTNELDQQDDTTCYDYDPENPPLDDWNDYDYEDRVDYWIEHSQWKDMKSMKEADKLEVPPGLAQYHSEDKRKILTIPPWINNTLFPYQRIGLQWMWELHLQESGGIVGDEMGLGKTVQICSFLGCMAASRHIRSVLIVAPATILSSWLSHLKEWSPGLRRFLIHKSHEENRVLTEKLLREVESWIHTARSECWYEAIDEEDLPENDRKQDEDMFNKFCGTGYVFVTTFENIRRNIDLYVSHRWDYVVLDEGQKIRNPDADVTLACKRLRTSHRLLLSGTPIQNDLKELWSLFDFVFPGRLGTLPIFESEFADPIRRGGYANASPAIVQLAYRCALILRDLINPFLLRRRKKDIKEVSRMPGKTEQILFCKLTNMQRSMYESYLKSDEVNSVIRGTAQCFKPIIVLRKICNHPDLLLNDPKNTGIAAWNPINVSHRDLTDSDDNSDSCDKSGTLVEASGKLQVLAKILPLWKEQGHRVLIFSQWKKMLDLIQQLLILQNITFSRMDGNTNVASRQQLVDRFNKDTSIFTMLLTTKTGGVGLNLTGANRIILYDPDWNPQSDAQARERAWRFGQRNSVTVYRFITAGTIEEKMYHRQIFKTALTNQVLVDPKQTQRLFSQRDLRDLFTLKPDADSSSSKKKQKHSTETDEITRGKGVVDVHDNDAVNNDNTLEEVMKRKGLVAGVFDHDFVDHSSSGKPKSESTKEMEAQAKKIAERSAKALQQSTNNLNSFTPTFTGLKQTQTRFGTNNNQRNDRHIKQKNVIEPTKAGIGTTTTNGQVPSSSALLASIQAKAMGFPR